MLFLACRAASSETVWVAHTTACGSEETHDGLGCVCNGAFARSHGFLDVLLSSEHDGMRATR